MTKLSTDLYKEATFYTLGTYKLLDTKYSYILVLCQNIKCATDTLKVIVFLFRAGSLNEPVGISGYW